jgi:hypothetical protein
MPAPQALAASEHYLDFMQREIFTPQRRSPYFTSR